MPTGAQITTACNTAGGHLYSIVFIPDPAGSSAQVGRSVCTRCADVQTIT